MDAVEPDAEFFGRHLRDFLKQALAHFGAAVIEMNGAVLIDVHQRAGLIEVRERERNAEFHRRQRDAALENRRARVEVLDLGAPPPVARRALQLLDQERRHVAIFDGLPVGRDVASGAVEIGLAHVERIETKIPGDGVDHALDRQHALRAAEAAERGV